MDEDSKSKKWKISYIVNFPGVLKVDGFPKDFQKSITSGFLIKSRFEMNGIKIRIEEVKDGDKDSYARMEPDVGIPASINIEVEGSDPFEAEKNAWLSLEPVRNLLSFQSQKNILVLHIEAANDKGEKFKMISPENPRSFVTSNVGVDFHPQALAVSKNMISRIDKKINLALDWYRKALSERSLSPKYVSLWISLEILCDKFTEKIIEPYKVGKCGHTINKCPECGASTEKPVSGTRIKKFLQELGASKKEVDLLWEIRHIVHGKSIAAFHQHLPWAISFLNMVVTKKLSEFLSV